MNSRTAKPATRNHLIALGLGMCLGQAVVLMARRQEGSMLGLAMALVLVASSSASFVLFILGQRDRQTVGSCIAEAHGLLGAIGAGTLLSMQANELIA